MPRGIILDCGGSTFKAASGMTSGEYIIKANRTCEIRDLNIDLTACNGGSGITDLAGVLVDGEAQISGEHTLTVQNVQVVSFNYEEIGFYMRADTNDEFCNGATFRDIRTNGCKYGFKIDTQGEGVNVGDSGDWSYQNDNLIDRFHDEKSTYHVWLDRNTSESNKNAVSCDANIFQNLFIQHGDGGSSSWEGIHVVGRGNRFINVHVWDWSGGYAWNITEDSENTYIEARGGTTGAAYKDDGNETTLIDYGTGSITLDNVFSGGYGIMTAYEFFGRLSGSRINANGYDNLILFGTSNPTNTRRYLRIYGDVDDVEYDATMMIGADKSFNIYSDENVTIGANDYLNVEDFLKLDPVTSHPSNPPEGGLQPANIESDGSGPGRNRYGAVEKRCSPAG